MALNSLHLNWSTGEVTTTVPTIPPSGPRQVQFVNGNSGSTNLVWSSSAWVANNNPTTPQPGDNVFLTNPLAIASQSPATVIYDAANIGGSQGALNSLTIDSNAGGSLLQLSQAANALASGSETIGTTGTAEHLQTGGSNTVTGTLTINGFGSYDLQGNGTLTAGTISVNNGGSFFFDGGTASFGTFNLNGGGTVASGTATSLASANAINFGTGTETVAAAGPGATFNQSGGVNAAGTLYIGNGFGNIGAYTQSGGTLTATSETIGYNGSFGGFTQTGGSNTVSGALTIAGGTLSGLGISIPTK